MQPKIKGFAFEIGRWHLLDVFSDAIECWITFANQRTTCMIDKTAEAKSADVVDPFCWGTRIGDHVFAVGIIEIAIIHR